MADEIRQFGTTSVLVCDPAGPAVATEQDALDLIGSAFAGAEVVAVPASRLDERFFRLGTRFAGEVMQKFVNYHLRLAVIGDIDEHTSGSEALRALVRESNGGRHIWFLKDLDALAERLASAPTPPVTGR
ncbi:DUF4180 domain-containing protein [Dactylosporangium sp. AC04546]|uniref:DUF4180 domain-containing protein n=1 Tax=Dactylosporangium sp. AC04546 TaxID=2862460 RepID=UPI001EE0783C|nr:DUF4180 domain-containing protein [Dactylosporangium sp. AC04546]WVK87869.1 DUF4180 domain-containing protein [Dactylosporangium sp. AC04546]